LLAFDTTDAAHTHFRLATLLRDAGQNEQAKRHVLMALEEAPRYLEAHQLLLKLVDSGEVPVSAESRSAADTQSGATFEVPSRAESRNIR
jgi:hypothetical protein